jgi:signal peptidase II
VGIFRKNLLLPASIILTIDQITKILAVERLENQKVVELFWTLQLNVTRNKGASFSLGTNLTPLLAVLALLAVIALVHLSKSAQKPVTVILFGVVLGGVLGNVIDRIFRNGINLNGGVVDFIDFQWWPVFNVADMALVVGLPFLLLARVREEETDE